MDLDQIILSLLKCDPLTVATITQELNVLDRTGALKDFEGLIGQSEINRALKRLKAAGRAVDALRKLAYGSEVVWCWRPERQVEPQGRTKQRRLLE